MTIEYQLTQDDLETFNLYHNRHSPFARQQFWKSLLVPVSVWLTLWIILWYLGNRGRNEPVQTAIALSPLLYMLPVYILIYPWLYRRAVRKGVAGMLKEGKNRDMYAKQHLTVTPEAIHSSNEFGQSTTYWRAVERLVEDEDHIYIYLSTYIALIIPRRAFREEGEFERFSQAAQGYYAGAQS